MRSIPATAFLLCIITRTIGQVANSWVNPPAYAVQKDWSLNRLWVDGEVQTIQWTTVFSNYRIELWQHDVNISSGANNKNLGTIYTSPRGVDSSNDGSFDYTVGSDLDFQPSSPILFTWLFDLNGDGSFSSYAVNLTQRSMSTSNSNQNASASNSNLNDNSSNSNQDDSSSGTTLALKVGMGVGIGLGIPLLLIVGGIIGWKIKRRRSDSSPRPSQENLNPPGAQAPPSYPDSTGNHEMQARKLSLEQLNNQGGYSGGQQPIYEMNSYQGRAELVG
ncbi:hypothetical protein CKM354_000077800 [Cercospora kikuchii]|uniref:Mid2 domain-containing protein n=1 Tax=Cercospora kikuchii TaxID=84275 RepID=A0A9P3C6P3_9PEZI|nr:uncharacterized protein CKM354_000077800 [Cercospora kikuchii]GIZ37328.1 hypothetical protein CKM354_000077800 [Cercospora kikuchii]